MRRKNITSEMMMEYIEQALLLLMKDKAYPDITIGEITAKAGVNRSTYYRHFDTKESIIHSYLDSIMETYQQRFQQLHSQDFTLYLRTMFETFYENKEKEFPQEELIREAERVILLRVIDTKWMDHIDDMDQLRQGIGLEAYGQTDPLGE